MTGRLSTHDAARLAGVTYRQLPREMQAKIDVDTDTGCWLWTGAIGAGGSGYALMTRRQVVHRVHRWTYEHLVGAIPAGLEIDHLCRVTRCVNPAHLEPVTHRENVRRHFAQFATCKWGHPWDAANTYVRPSTGRRECRACNRQNQRRLALRRSA